METEADEVYHFVDWTGDVDTIGDVNAAITTITMEDNYSIMADFGPGYTPMVAAGGYHAVGLRADGTVVAMGYKADGRCDVGWMLISKVATDAWLDILLEPLTGGR